MESNMNHQAGGYKETFLLVAIINFLANMNSQHLIDTALGAAIAGAIWTVWRIIDRAIERREKRKEKEADTELK